MLNNCEHNLRAYKGVEDLTTFISKEAIEKYREERKRFASGAVTFLRKEIRGKVPVSVLDIGSGSSCFLYALHDAGILSRGMGIEISKTRYDFAERWKRDGQYKSVENINMDVRKASFESRKFDVCTILDSTFNLFHSVDSGLPSQVLQRIHKALNIKGWLILEMSSFLDVKRLCKDSGVYYKWEELPESNKFLYSLYRIDCSFQDGLACIESRYLHRNKLGESKKIDYSKIYTVAELEKMVLKARFKEPFFYGGYDGKPYDSENSNRILLTCQKDN